jgi:hypothetical protein
MSFEFSVRIVNLNTLKRIRWNMILRSSYCQYSNWALIMELEYEKKILGLN